MTATRRNAAATDVELQTAARVQIDAAVAAGAIPARPSPETIAAVADVVAAVHVPETRKRRRKVAAVPRAQIAAAIAAGAIPAGGAAR
jgi:hypothetical protein